MTINVAINLDYLLPTLRFQLGDTDPATYRYVDGWLRVALITGVKALQRWWGAKYLVEDTTYAVSRSADVTFDYDEPPLILDSDERPLILMASILVKSGSLESNSWNVGSWKDAEIAVSTIEGNKAKTTSLGMDWDELKAYIMPPTRRLSGALRIEHPSTDE
jgi:hypothetical protein